MEHGLVTAIHRPGSGQELPGAGGDRLLGRLVEIAGRHGVEPAFDLPGS
jgi:hypothetical protein